MDYNIKLNITKENNEYIQDIVLKLAMKGIVKQEEARELFSKAEELNGIHIYSE